MRQLGTVILFKVDKGYGFIRTSEGSSLFFHINEVRDRLILDAGDQVEFQAGPAINKPEKIECSKIVLVGRAVKAVQS